MIPEKERDIENATYLIRREMAVEKERYGTLMKEMHSVQVQLSEAKNGLLAAARISDQLESSQRAAEQQKEESKCDNFFHALNCFIYYLTYYCDHLIFDVILVPIKFVFYSIRC